MQDPGEPWMLRRKDGERWPALLDEYEATIDALREQLAAVTEERDMFAESLERVQAAGYQSSPMAISRMIQEATAVLKGKKPSFNVELITEWMRVRDEAENRAQAAETALAAVERKAEAAAAQIRDEIPLVGWAVNEEVRQRLEAIADALSPTEVPNDR